MKYPHLILILVASLVIILPRTVYALTPTPSPTTTGASCLPGPAVCGFNLDAGWGAASDIMCDIPLAGVSGDRITVSPLSSACMGGYDSGTYTDAGKGSARLKCEGGVWKTYWPYYFWTYQGWTGCGRTISTSLVFKQSVTPFTGSDYTREAVQVPTRTPLSYPLYDDTTFTPGDYPTQIRLLQDAIRKLTERVEVLERELRVIRPTPTPPTGPSFIDIFFGG